MILLALPLLLLSSSAVPAAPQATPVARIVADYDRLGDDAGPTFALPDVTPPALAKRRAALQRFHDRLAAVPAAGLSPDDRLDKDLLAWAVDEQLGVLRFDEARMPFDSDGGFDVNLVYIAGNAQLKSAADVAGWLHLIGAVPDYYAANIANARRGIATGFTQPAMTVKQVLVRARAAAAAPAADDPLLQPIENADLPADQKAVALAQARQLIESKVRPAETGFIQFLERDYLPHARASLAVTSLPDGKAYYAWLVRRYTTTDLTPDQIHAIGVKEVARIRAEMDAAMQQAHFTGSFAAFLTFLRTDKQFYATSREQLLDIASRIAKRIDYTLPAHFATLPRLTYGVLPVPRAIEDNYTTGRYFPGDPSRGIAGGLMINTSHLDQRPLYELPALELHEGAPGHHIQIALAQEAAGLPEFRRNSYYSAYGEGWALYSEWLGNELGIYQTPYEKFGQLSYDMWRACRLVADTGIHSEGWTLDQARACFTDNSALSPHNIDTELQRYVSWPGQALSYKIGEITIRALRTKAENELGPCFDERHFHDAILLGGAMPLAILQQQVGGWIDAQRSAHMRGKPSGGACGNVAQD